MAKLSEVINQINEENKIPEDNQQKVVDNSISNNKDIIRLKNKHSIEQKSTNSDERDSIEEKNINVDILIK